MKNRIMKGSLKHIALLLTGIFFITGCDHYLEQNPDNRVELNTPEKAAQLLTNAYSSAGYTFTEWMSDNVSYTLNTTKLPETNQAYTWADFTGLDQDTPNNFWTSTYDAISHSNEVLAVVDNMAGDKSKIDAVKGEALLTRAYGHFMLVNLFAKQYDAKTASTDLGVPYVEEPETVFIKKYSRNTVKEVYDKVERDFKAGLKLVNAAYYANSGKYHFTKNSALALASRFYLFKGDYTNCINYSNQLLGADPSLYVKDIPALLAEKINTDDYIRLYHAPSDDSNLLLVRQITNFPVPNVGYWLSSAMYNALRFNPYSLDDRRLEVAYVAGNGIALSKYELLFQRSSLTSNVGLNYTVFLGFRGEEVLLNRAEAYLQTSTASSSNLNLALADLQRLATKRYTGNTSPTLTSQTLALYYNGTSDLDNAFQYLMDERMKEFMHEGLKWFDLKRFHIPVTHVLADGSEITLQADDKRKILQIPKAAIDIGGLEPNPR